jgi:hypothetical protein
MIAGKLSTIFRCTYCISLINRSSWAHNSTEGLQNEGSAPPPSQCWAILQSVIRHFHPRRRVHARLPGELFYYRFSPPPRQSEPCDPVPLFWHVAPPSRTPPWAGFYVHFLLKNIPSDVDRTQGRKPVWLDVRNYCGETRCLRRRGAKICHQEASKSCSFKFPQGPIFIFFFQEIHVGRLQFINIHT